MKKIFLLFFLAVGLIFLLPHLSFFTSDVLPPSALPSPSPSPSPSSLNSVIFDQQTYLYDYFKVDSLNNLDLYLNLTDQLSTQELIDRYHCQGLINANFYDQSYKPLGLFVTDYQTLYPAITSSLFNGFLSLDDSPHITVNKPSGVRLAVQSGPLLFLDQSPLKLNINQDEPRRRSVSFIDTSQQLYFMIIIKPDTSYSGPLLVDLPSVLQTIAVEENITINSAINLDGGTASAFFRSSTYLKEFAVIGSVFCLH